MSKKHKPASVSSSKKQSKKAKKEVRLSSLIEKTDRAITAVMEEYSDSFDSAIEREINSALWILSQDPQNSGLHIPQLADYDIHIFSTKKGEVQCDIDYKLDYHGIYATRRISVVKRVCAGDEQTDAQREAGVLALVESVISQIKKNVLALPVSVPQGIEEQKQFMSLFRDVSFGDDCNNTENTNELFEELLNANSERIKTFLRPKCGKLVSAYIKTHRADYASIPPDAAFVTPVSTEIFMEVSHDFTVSCICLQVFRCKAERCVPLFEICNMNVSLLHAFMAGEDMFCQTAANDIWDEMSKHINLDGIPLCYVPMQSMPRIIQELSNTEGFVYGKIRGMCADMPYTNCGYCCAYKPNGTYSLVGRDLLAEKNEQMDFSLEDVTNPVFASYNADTETSLAIPVFQFPAFCKEMSALYDEFQDSRFQEKPELSVVYENGEVTTCTWRTGMLIKADMGTSKKKTIFSDELCARDKIQRIFIEVAEHEGLWLSKLEAYRPILGKLNPSEFKIYKYISQSGPVCEDEIIEELQDTLATTPECIHQYLMNLSEIWIVPYGPGSQRTLQQGGSFPLVYYTKQKGRGAVGGLVYTTPVNLIDYAFEYLQPRPFTMEELDDLKPENQQKLFLPAVRAAVDTKSRWRAMIIAEHQPPKTIKQFCRTDEGKAFFSSFEGEDALYAKFFLQGIPGCEQFAETLA